MRFGERPIHAGEQLGPYRILDTLGSGGMGVVYAAWDTRLDRKIALKMIRGHLLSDEAVAKRFLREAKAAARIEHPNVVRVYGLEPLGNELAIEMQYIEGRPLSLLLGGAPMTLGHVLGYMEQALTALVACHEQGVIHCDLKPGNLLITDAHHLYLADFGIARALDNRTPENTTMTAGTGPFWGTPRYCPPEAWEEGKPDFRWDLYALGVVFYEALSGACAFAGSTPAAVMKQVVLSTPVPITERRPDVSPALAALIHDLMARDPAARPQSARDALGRLRALPEYSGSHAATLPLERVQGPRAPRFVGWRPRRLVASTAFILLLLVAVSAAWMYRNNTFMTATPEEPSPPSSGLPEPSELTPSGSAVHFVYDDGVHGPELWYANSVGSIGMVRDLVPGAQGSHPRRLFSLPTSNVILFSARTPEYGEELWYARQFSPEEYEVAMVRDIIPGTMGSEPHCFGTLDGLVLFYATTLEAGRELWMTNTREQQTAMIADLFPGRHGSNMMNPEAVMGEYVMYFLGLARLTHGKLLFSYDVRDQSFREILALHDDGGAMGMAGEALLFTNQTDDFGMELWVLPTPGASPRLLLDIVPGSGSGDPGDLAAWQGRVYFHAYTPETGVEPWVSDGTAAGTQLLLDINPGPASSDAHAFVGGAGGLFFRATNVTHGKELWLTDGTPEGTRMAADVWAGPDSTDPYNVVAAEDRLFFTGREPRFGEELYQYRYSDGAVTRLGDFWPGPSGSEPYEFTRITGKQALFRLKLPGSEPAIGLIRWHQDPPEVSILRLPFATSPP